MSLCLQLLEKVQMVKLQIEVDTTHLKPLGPKTEEAIKKGVNYTADYTIERLQANSPVDTGHLKGWFRYKDEGSMVDIRSPAKYAIFQDQGTYSYGPLGRKPKTKDVGGIKPKRFVEKSINATKGRINGFFIKAIKEVLE